MDAFAYIESDIPEGVTIDEFRRAVSASGPPRILFLLPVVGGILGAFFGALVGGAHDE